MEIETAHTHDVYDGHSARGIEAIGGGIDAIGGRPASKLTFIAAPAQTPRRLLFIAYQFAPSMEMGARACAQIARYLPLYGWSPVVLTAHENDIEERYRGSANEIDELGLADAVVKTRTLPHPFDFYRWLRAVLRRKPQNNVGPNGAGTAAGPDTPLGQKGWLRRSILSALSFPDKYNGWILPAIVAGLKAARKSKAQQIFSSGPYWTNHLVGLALSYLTGMPWIAHFRDPWIVGAGELPIPPLAYRLNEWLERLVATRATSIVLVTEQHAAALRLAFPHLPPDKFAAVPNGYDGGEWDELPMNVQRDEKSKEKLLILYTGTFYIGRDPQPLFRALKSLIDSGEITGEQVQVDLIGWCETSVGRPVKEMIAEHGLSDCVNILGPRSRPETLRRMTQADLLLLLGEGLVMQIPGKTYEYLRAGRPILALTPEGALADLMRRTGGGWVVNQNDDAGVLAAVREIFQQWKKGRIASVADPAAVEAFDRRALAGRFAGLFDRLS
jgi:glycosyltransferase involved in cell wall biosynthesis